jgi:hypothetical protein
MHVDPRNLLGYPFDYIRQQVFSRRIEPPRPQAGANVTLTWNALGPVIAATAGSNQFTPVIKSADEARNTTTTLTDDSTLVVPMTGGTKYLLRCRVLWNIANATMDFKYGLAYSGSMTHHYRYIRAADVSAAAGTDAVSESFADSLVASQAITVTAVTHFGLLEFYIVAEPSTSGTWSFQWAQNTSNASDATVMAGSIVEWAPLP